MCEMRLRTLIFWTHLLAGLTAGAVILVMCATGVLLTYERQIYAWYDSGFRSQPTGVFLSIESLLVRAQDQAPTLRPSTIVLAAAPDAAVTIGDGGRTLLFDAYSGRLLGETRTQGVRQFFASVKAWHRWLAAEGDQRTVARAVTGWSNLAFAFIVASGVYLWFPRRWTWARVRAIVLFKGGLRGKARDFNWHNVIGSWSAAALFVVVVSALPMSFPWANDVVYRAVGDRAPAAGGREGGARDRGRGTARQTGPNANTRPDRRDESVAANAPSFDGLDRLFARATTHVAGWRTITLRLPASPGAPVAFAIDRGDGGQPQLRSTLTLARNSGDLVSYETFGSQSPGRRLRSIMRFAHTGEVFGIAGQTIAAVVTAGGAVLVYTGFALAVRRSVAWAGRRAPAPRVESTAA
jgi:uncharacterized iron-regulated membrane protein